MRIFSQAFAGGFAGKIVASIFVAVCFALGIGPDTWAAYLLDVQISPWITRSGFILLGLLTAFAIVPAERIRAIAYSALAMLKHAQDYRLRLDHRDQPKPPVGDPDYDKWDEQNVLRLFEAACLWNEEEPALSMSAASLRTFRDFYQAIYEKRLGTKADLNEAIKLGMAQTGWKVAPSEDDPVNVNTKVSRQHLKPYAEKIGVRPKFLYPDQRAGRRPA